MKEQWGLGLEGGKGFGSGFSRVVTGFVLCSLGFLGFALGIDSFRHVF